MCKGEYVEMLLGMEDKPGMCMGKKRKVKDKRDMIRGV